MDLPAEVTPREAFDAVSRGALLVDVREPWEHAEQHIAGAVLIPLNELPARLAEIPADRDVYVHCRMGGRSARAVDVLRQSGRPRTSNVAGGIEGWVNDQLPVEAAD